MSDFILWKANDLGESKITMIKQLYRDSKMKRDFFHGRSTGHLNFKANIHQVSKAWHIDETAA